LEEVFGIVFDYTEFSFNYNLNSFKAEKLHVAIYLQFFINLKFFEPLEGAARRGNQHAAAALSIIYAIAALQKNSMSARLASESQFWKNAVISNHLLKKEKAKLESRLKKRQQSAELELKKRHSLCCLSRKQKMIFRLITPIVKKLTNAANFQRFQESPALFFRSLKKRKYRFFGEIFFPVENHDHPPKNIKFET